MIAIGDASLIDIGTEEAAGIVPRYAERCLGEIIGAEAEKLAALGNLTNLREMSLYSNQLTGSIPPELGNMASLEHLDLTTGSCTTVLDLDGRGAEDLDL